jgi:hypothetical protein
VRDATAPSHLPEQHRQAIAERDRVAPATLQSRAFALQILYLHTGYQAVPATAGISLNAIVRRMQASHDIVLPVQHRCVLTVSMRVADASAPADFLVVRLIVVGGAGATLSRYLLLSRVSRTNHITLYCAAIVAAASNGLVTGSLVRGYPAHAEALHKESMLILQDKGLRMQLRKHRFYLTLLSASDVQLGLKQIQFTAARSHLATAF